MKKCLKCETDTKNAKFCSRSCAASYNNSLKAKRARTKTCECGNLVLAKRKYCEECFEKYFRRDYSKTTLKSLKQESGSRNSYSTLVRSHARSVLKRVEPDERCKICAYDTHVDCCHIRDVKSFSEEAVLTEVNSLENLVWLCPNHHWEFDNDCLDTGQKDLLASKRT